MKSFWTDHYQNGLKHGIWDQHRPIHRETNDLRSLTRLLFQLFCPPRCEIITLVTCHELIGFLQIVILSLSSNRNCLPNQNYVTVNQSPTLNDLLWFYQIKFGLGYCAESFHILTAMVTTRVAESESKGVGVWFLATLAVGVGFLCSTSTPEVQLDHFLHHTPELRIPVQMVQFLLKLLLKQKFLAVHHYFHWF